MKFTEFYPTKPGPKKLDKGPQTQKEIGKPDRELRPYRNVVPKA